MESIFGRNVFGSYTAMSRSVGSYEPMGSYEPVSGFGDDADKGCGPNEFWSYNNDECVQKAVTSKGALPNANGCPPGYMTDPLNPDFCSPNPATQKSCPAGQTQTWDFSNLSQQCCPTGWFYEAGKGCYPGTPLTSGTKPSCPAGSKLGPDGFQCVPAASGATPGPKPVIPPPAPPAPSSASLWTNPLVWGLALVVVGGGVVAYKKMQDKKKGAAPAVALGNAHVWLHFQRIGPQRYGRPRPERLRRVPGRIARRRRGVRGLRAGSPVRRDAPAHRGAHVQAPDLGRRRERSSAQARAQARGSARTGALLGLLDGVRRRQPPRLGGRPARRGRRGHLVRAQEEDGRPRLSGASVDPLYLYTYPDTAGAWKGEGWFVGAYTVIPAVGYRWVSAEERAKRYLGQLAGRSRGWWGAVGVDGSSAFGRYGEMTSSNVNGTTILSGGQLAPYTPDVTGW